MGRTRFAWKRDSIAAAIIFSLSATAQAAPANVIFAAENALHGAGYDVGQADGWLDNDLRLAIRRYQSGTDGISNTGNLDGDTLSALGIASTGEVISDNALPNRKAALAALDLRPAAPAPRASRQVVKTAPPEPKPEPEQEIRKAPEPEPGPVKVEVASAPAEARQLTEPTPEPRESASAAARQETEAPVTSSPEPAVAGEPVETPAVRTQQALESAPQTDTATAPAPQVEVTAFEQEPSAAPDSNSGNAPSSDVLAAADTTASSDASEEYVAEVETAAVVNTAEQPAEAQKNGGGFFGNMFSLLFGWMI
ncbi:peptidoglycan-binding protein [Marinobacter sp.]|uniref:peptidoglycan-binding protein n=1 Tax=Marinobacter sp. TaxID=50741 RepID=UPI00384C7620